MSKKPVVVIVTSGGSQPIAPNAAGVCKLFPKVLATCVKKAGKHAAAHFIDMHNVLDLFHPDDSPWDELCGLKVCISWVGNVMGTTAGGMIPDMQERIREGQIHFGVICSARGKKPRRQKKGESSGRELKAPETKGRAICVDPYSKAGIVNSILQLIPHCEESHFYDDAADHAESVASLSLPILLIHHITRENTPEKVCDQLKKIAAAEQLAVLKHEEAELAASKSEEAV